MSLLQNFVRLPVNVRRAAKFTMLSPFVAHIREILLHAFPTLVFG
jgi:hypothetical protein